MIKQAYTLTRKNDPKLPWIMLIAFVAVAGVIELVGILLGSPFLFLPLAIITGGLAALIIFGRRAQGSAYRQVEGQPGAAAWVLEGMRGDWRVTSGVAGTAQLDAVHRVLGRPGVILVAEGAPQPGPRPARAGEEEGRPHRRRHPDLRHRRRRRRGPDPAAQAQQPRHEAAPQPHRRRGQRARPADERAWAAAACRCPAARCPAGSRCRSASARSAAAATPGLVPSPRRAGRTARRSRNVPASGGPDSCRAWKCSPQPGRVPRRRARSTATNPNRR